MEFDRLTIHVHLDTSALDGLDLKGRVRPRRDSVPAAEREHKGSLAKIWPARWGRCLASR
jgi:hypothetical protein